MAASFARSRFVSLMCSRTFALALAGALALALGCDRDAPAAAPSPAPAVVPHELRDTGLFADFEQRIVADDVQPFVPQYPLWSDGATKRRWIRLPAGAVIDASDPDAWSFPTGTQLWKEFTFGGRVVETRYMQLGADGRWAYATYVWSADGRSATLSATTGGDAVAPAVALAGGAQHVVPGLADCTACHDATRPVLGFSALQLSSDRDPLAPHAEPVPEGAVDLAALLAAGRIVGDLERLQVAPRIAAASPRERAARGYLHGNCGGCHRDDGPLAPLGMDLSHHLAPHSAPDLDDDNPVAIATTVGRRSRAPLPSAPSDPRHDRIVAGEPDRSVLLGRMRSRDVVHQMPPLGTRVVDDDAVALVGAWIAELAAPRS